MAATLAPAQDAAGLKHTSLADAPDYLTAVAAGITHGLGPSEALKSAFGKWLTEHAEAVQRFGIANWYDGPDASRAFVNQTRLVQYLCVRLADQERDIADLRSEIATMRATTSAAEIPSVSPSRSAPKSSHVAVRPGISV